MYIIWNQSRSYNSTSLWLTIRTTRAFTVVTKGAEKTCCVYNQHLPAQWYSALCQQQQQQQQQQQLHDLPFSSENNSWQLQMIGRRGVIGKRLTIGKKIMTENQFLTSIKVLRSISPTFLRKIQRLFWWTAFSKWCTDLANFDL
jgi:hypothetical protein